MVEEYALPCGTILSFDNTYPENYQGLVIPGSVPFLSRGDWGVYFVQQVKCMYGKLRYQRLQIDQSQSIHMRSQHKGLRTIAILHNSCRHTVAGVGRIYLKKGQFVSLYGSTGESSLSLQQDERCVFLECLWNEDELQKIIPHMHHVRHLLQRPFVQVPELIGSPYRNITPALRRLIDYLTYSPYDTMLQHAGMDDLVETCLLEMLLASADQDWTDPSINSAEMRKVWAARDLIHEDLSSHLHTSEIAHRVGLNECTLKRRFKQVMGKSLFEYLLYQRCMKVREKILTTDLPVKAFYREAGYRDMANFIHGFKRHIGCYPMDLRKGKK